MKWSFLTLLIFTLSCTKDRNSKFCGTGDFTDATVINAGPLESDGCGWVIKIGNTQYYHPDVLTAEFMQNDLPVKIRYELTPDTFHCGITATGLSIIHLLEIKK